MKKEKDNEDEEIMRAYMNYLANEEMVNLFSKPEFKDEAEQKRAISALIEVLHNDPECLPILGFFLREGYKETPPIWTAEVIYKTAEAIEVNIKIAMGSLRPKKLEMLKVQLDTIRLTLGIRSDKPVIKNAVERVKEKLLWYEEHINSLLEEEKSAAKESGYFKNPNILEESKIVFKPEAIPQIFDILKDHFPKTQQGELKRIIETGDNSKEALFFMGSGNRLADAFKQLYVGDFITGCEKKELEGWIAKNFQFRWRQEVKNFSARYLNDIISTPKDKCENPLLNLRRSKENGSYIIEKA